MNDFFDHVKKNNIRLYNEFSLQHELGIFLRATFPGYFVEFERNVSFFGITSPTVKKEIDIVIYNADKSEKCAIELKYPRNGQHPEEMYAFVLDVKFMEQMKANGFETHVLTLVEDPKFFSTGSKLSGIYSSFRVSPNVIPNKVYKPTGVSKGRKSISLSKSYSFNWISASWSDGDKLPNEDQRYYCITL
ncbi:MAG: type I restriction enzyme HsdR N-terminal domain-containing protein [Paludibacteraceae bacterium]|nr:type I restriction enzyme HsdR N-terminal domain-containing protein [Paludibacteraceae bacterium]